MPNNVHIIDCDAAPNKISQMKFDYHKKMGILSIIPSKIYLMPASYFCNEIIEDTLSLYCFNSVILDDKGLNANVVDYFLKHKECIPDDWKGKKICFYNTKCHYKGKSYRHTPHILCLKWEFWRDDYNNYWTMYLESSLDNSCYFALNW